MGEDIMGKVETKAATPEPSASAPLPPVTSSDMTVDAASFVYEKAKDVWGWGKDRIPLVPGLTEAVVSKVVGVVGTDLGEIDSNIKPALALLDDGVLNPAITKVVETVMVAYGKSEEVIKPVVIAIITPLHSLIKNEPETVPETKEAIAPEVTTSTVNLVA